MTITDDMSAGETQETAGRTSRGKDAMRGGARLLGWAVLAFIAFVVFGLRSPFGYPRFDTGMLAAICLVGGGLLLLRARTTDQVDNERQPVQRSRSPLGVLTLSLAFVVVGIMVLLNNLELAHISLGQVAASGLLVVGLGLLAGSWWGRSRWLILVGLIMIPPVLVGGFMHFPLRGSIGDQFISPYSVHEVSDRYEVLLGTVTLDLLNIQDFPTTRSLDLQVAAGKVTIFLPERVGLTVTGDIEWGNATVGRGREQGEDLHFTNRIAGRPGSGHLNINFNGGIASLYIERISHREIYGDPTEDLEGFEPAQGQRANEPTKGRTKKQKERRSNDDKT
jgi:hypothetical protein